MRRKRQYPAGSGLNVVTQNYHWYRLKLKDKKPQNFRLKPQAGITKLLLSLIKSSSEERLSGA